MKLHKLFGGENISRQARLDAPGILQHVSIGEIGRGRIVNDDKEQRFHHADRSFADTNKNLCVRSGS